MKMAIFAVLALVGLAVGASALSLTGGSQQLAWAPGGSSVQVGNG